MPDEKFEASNETKVVLGAPKGDWRVQPPDDGEWLIAIALPPNANVPRDVMEAAQALAATLGISAESVDPLCRTNICNGNTEICGKRKG